MAMQFDPWQAELLADWRNRLTKFVQSPAEPIFHTAVFFALSIMFILILTTSLRANANAIKNLLSEWPLASAFSLTAWFIFVQIRSLNKRVKMRLNGWLVAQPIRHQVWLLNARQSAAWLCALQMACISVIGYSLLVSLAVFLVAFSCALLGGLLVSIRPELFCTSLTQHVAQRPILGGIGAGRMWRWQLAEARTIIGPKRFALMLVPMLLVPSNSRIWTITGSLFAVLAIVLLVDAWRKSLMVLPMAHQWMATQPVLAQRLLLAWVQFPAAIVGVLITLLALTLYNLGALNLIGPFALVILIFSGLAIACVAAERKKPRRIAMLLSLHVLVLLIVVQTLPPAAALAWPLQMMWLLRRSLVE